MQDDDSSHARDASQGRRDPTGPPQVGLGETVHFYGCQERFFYAGEGESVTTLKKHRIFVRYWNKGVAPLEAFPSINPTRGLWHTRKECLDEK